MGDDRSSADRMLVSVVALSVLVAPQLEENGELEYELDGPRMLVRCGREPARSLESRTALFKLVCGPLAGVSREIDVDGGLKGLVDGVGRDVLEYNDC